jgi:hypothetical protein
MKWRSRSAPSTQERREADLFFADLTGLTTPPSSESARVYREAEDFFAELIGEAPPVLLRPSVTILPPPGLPAAPRPFALPEFGEQGGPAVPLPSPMVANWTGVDRHTIPTHVVARRTVGDTAWMGTLLDNSTLRFTGAYVTGSPPAGQERDFTGSSKDVARLWMPNIQTLADQGWGAVFFYVGYSLRIGHRAPAGVGRARGTAHGLHLRTTLNALGPSWAGATVCIDNEDEVRTDLTIDPTKDLVEYYLGLFEEMSRPDANLAAFRPALYGHGQPVEQLLARRRDLFVWDVQQTAKTANPPFGRTADPITIDPTTRPIRPYRATPAGQGPFVTWPLGRQFVEYTGDMPVAPSAVATRLPAWRAEPRWDYNVSFVRNPAFPVAEPRLAARRHPPDIVVVADFFVPRGVGVAPAAPSARVTTQGPGVASGIAVAAGVTVEPDAPLTLFPRGGEILLATVLSDGGIGLATRTALTGAWTNIDRISGTVPALRRSRALQGVANAVSNAHVFFIGADHQLYVKRRTGTGGWSDGQPVTADLRLHPFSALAGEARRGDTVDTFFIDEQGLLTTAFWARWFTTPFPGFLVQRLQTAPSLLPGGALAATCPHPDHLLVFGIGTDQRLHFAFFVHGRGWSAVAPAGAAADLIGAHGRLAVAAISGTEVEVAALTDAGQLAVYPVRLTGTTWAAAARQVVPDPPALAGTAPAPPPGAILQPASGFRINPFGDLAIVRPPRHAASTVVCAGLRAGEAKTLRWNAAGADAWQYFV